MARLGSAGNRKTKHFTSAYAAREEYNKLIKSKLKKGYLEVSFPAGNSRNPVKTVDTAGKKLPFIEVKRYERIRPEMHKYWEVIRVGNSICTYNTEISTSIEGGGNDMESPEAAAQDVENLCATTVKNGYFEVKGLPGLGKLDPGIQIREELPGAFKKAFQAEGILNEKDMFLPIKCVGNLGQTPAGSYHACPNVPDYHLECCGLYVDTFDDLGNYYWFDHDLTGKDGRIFPLRLVICLGHADTNDGIWGAYWNRETEEVVANLKSIGSNSSALEIASAGLQAEYLPHHCLIPDQSQFDPEYENYVLTWPVSPQNQLEIEKVLIAGIRLADYYMSTHR